MDIYIAFSLAFVYKDYTISRCVYRGNFPFKAYAESNRRSTER